MPETCRVTIHGTVPLVRSDGFRAVAYPCGRPVVALSLCRRHLRAHRRLCASAACGCGDAS